MIAVSAEVLERAIRREPEAVRALVAAVAPVIQARVARTVLRQRSTREQRRDPREEVRDLAQEVFAALFDDDAKALRAWRPGGLSLVNYVGLIAEHQVANIFKSGRRRPWADGTMVEDDVDAFSSSDSGGAGAERRVASRQLYAQLLERLRTELTPRGLELFHALIVNETPVEEVCASTGMNADAVYAWRSRLSKLVRKLAAELDSERRIPPAAEREAAP